MSSRFGDRRRRLDVAAHVDRRLAIRRVGDAARRAHVVRLNRADDVVGGEARSRRACCGSTVTSSAGVTVPLALTFETPGTCSSAGTILLVTIAERSARLSECEVTESVTIVACAGSNVRTVGAGRSDGSAARAVCTRSCTSVRSVVWFESSVNVARDRGLILLDRRVDVIEVGRAGDRIFDRPHDRVAQFRRRTRPDTTTLTVHRRKVDVRRCSAARASRARTRRPARRARSSTKTSGGRLTKSCVSRIVYSCGQGLTVGDAELAVRDDALAGFEAGDDRGRRRRRRSP